MMNTRNAGKCVQGLNNASYCDCPAHQCQRAKRTWYHLASCSAGSLALRIHVTNVLALLAVACKSACLNAGPASCSVQVSVLGCNMCVDAHVCVCACARVRASVCVCVSVHACRICCQCSLQLWCSAGLITLNLLAVQTAFRITLKLTGCNFVPLLSRSY